MAASVSFVVPGPEAVSQVFCLNCLGIALGSALLERYSVTSCCFSALKWHNSLNELEPKLELRKTEKLVLDQFLLPPSDSVNMFTSITSLRQEGLFEKHSFFYLCVSIAANTHTWVLHEGLNM